MAQDKHILKMEINNMTKAQRNNQEQFTSTDNRTVTEYKGYKIYPRSKTVYRTTHEDGRRFETAHRIAQKGFYISGKCCGVTDKYTSLKKAHEHIDFVIKFLVPHFVPIKSKYKRNKE